MFNKWVGIWVKQIIYCIQSLENIDWHSESRKGELTCSISPKRIGPIVLLGVRVIATKVRTTQNTDGKRGLCAYFMQCAPKGIMRQCSRCTC